MLKSNVATSMRVILNDKAHAELVGHYATVINFDGRIAGLKMDEMLFLHDCNGDTEQGHGWYEDCANFEEENVSLICRLMPKDKELMSAIRSHNVIAVGAERYSKRENASFTFFEKNGDKVIVIKSGITVPVVMNCKCEEDRKFINHVLDLYKVSEGQALTLIDGKYIMVAFSTKVADAFEKKLLKPPTKKEIISAMDEKGKTVNVTSEAELYASLGITV